MKDHPGAEKADTGKHALNDPTHGICIAARLCNGDGDDCRSDTDETEGAKACGLLVQVAVKADEGPAGEGHQKPAQRLPRRHDDHRLTPARSAYAHLGESILRSASIHSARERCTSCNSRRRRDTGRASYKFPFLSAPSCVSILRTAAPRVYNHLARRPRYLQSLQASFERLGFHACVFRPYFFGCGRHGRSSDSRIGDESARR